MDYDVLIIGGGVTGSSIARFTARYNLKVALLERHSELCTGTSKANSGIVHAGYDPAPGTLKARLNVRGNELMHQLKDVLDFDLVENGAMVLSFTEEGLESLNRLYSQGLANGVPDMRIIGHDEILELEPNVNPDVRWALYLGSSAIVDPFSLTYAMAENAYDNGVEFRFSEPVESIERIESGYRVVTGVGEYTARVVVNAAGLYSDVINNMVSPDKLTVSPRRGEYMLLDRSEEGFVRHTLFQLPTKAGKGVLVTPTTHGNILCGPDSTVVEDKENSRTDAEVLSDIQSKCRLTAPSVNFRKVITSFTGLRAHLSEGSDFRIDMPVEGFVNAAGIESPGLASSPAIGEYVSDMVAEYLKAEPRKDFKAERKGYPKLSELPLEERNELIRKNPLYGNIICRCEEISEGEIVDAIRRPLGASTLDGVKRRCRAGMGRCQAGFCSPKVMEIISRELGIPMEDIKKNEEGSEVIL